MAMGNLPTLVENTLLGFSETAGALYLKLLDVFEGWSNRANERRAFLAADHYERSAGGTLDYILRSAPFHRITDEVRSELAHFFAERWRHNFMQATGT